MSGGDDIDLELAMSAPEHRHAQAAHHEHRHPLPAPSSSSSSLQRHFLSRPPEQEHMFFPVLSDHPSAVSRGSLERRLQNRTLSRRPADPPPGDVIASRYSAGRSSSALAPPLSSVAVAPANELVDRRPSRRGCRGRRNSGQLPQAARSEVTEETTISPPYPWATNLRAVVHSKNYLLHHGIRAISGEVKCRRCERQMTLSYDLEDTYEEVKRFIAAKKHTMHDRAPAQWTTPSFPPCPDCKMQNAMKPVIGGKKREINWLFLLLSQTLGCCTLEQLKYFCKHTKNHRTGAKDRVLYLAFLGICKQVEPLQMYDCNT